MPSSAWSAASAKEAEKKLKEQAALLDVALDAILVKDLENHNAPYWNKSAERIYGWSAGGGREKYDGSPVLRDVRIRSQGSPERKQSRKRNGTAISIKAQTDGRNLIIEGRWTLVQSERGEPKGILSVNSDVTAQRSIQGQLLRSQRLESLGTLAGGIAHDLNNVLSPILMGMEALSFHNPDISTLKIVEIIKTSAQRGADIVRQILNFTRGVEGEHGEVQLKHLVREIEGVVRGPSAVDRLEMRHLPGPLAGHGRRHPTPPGAHESVNHARDAMRTAASSPSPWGISSLTKPMRR